MVKRNRRKPDWYGGNRIGKRKSNRMSAMCFSTSFEIIERKDIGLYSVGAEEGEVLEILLNAYRGWKRIR